MSLFTEAGVFSYVNALLFLVAVFALVRGHRGWAPLSISIGALGLLGASLGQRLVDGAVGKAPELAQKVAILSAGTREASANLLIAGGLLFCLALLSGLKTLRASKG